MHNIAIVHFCYMINDWYEKLSNQLERAKLSGLYDAAKEYHLVVTDASKEKHRLESILSNYTKIKLDYHNDNKLYETYAIQKVHELGLANSNLNILYFHNKGVYNNGIKNYNSKEISVLKKESVLNFIEILEYFLIDKWEDCVNKLNEGYHIVGVNCVFGQWWGNFWWTRSEYLKTNEDFKFNENIDSRWKCERWIHIGNSIHATPEFKPYEFYHFWCDNYYTVIPKCFYDGTDRSKIDIIIHKAEYGYFAEAQHELQPLPLHENITYDVTDVIKQYFLSKEDCLFDVYLNQNILPIIEYPHIDKRLRIQYSINNDDIIYTASSIPDTQIQFITKIQL